MCRCVDKRCDVCGLYPKKQRHTDVITCTKCSNMIGRTEERARRIFGA